METVETLIVLNENTVAQAILLSKDDRFWQLPYRFVHLGVGDVALAQTGVGAMIAAVST